MWGDPSGVALPFSQCPPPFLGALQGWGRGMRGCVQTDAQGRAKRGLSRTKLVWCERGDSNPHGFPRQILSLVRLPIPPLSHALNYTSTTGDDSDFVLASLMYFCV